MRLGIREEIYEEVYQFRRNAYELNSRQNQNIIKKKKGVSEINLTNFLRRFVGFDSLIKIHETKTLRENCKFFTEEIKDKLPTTSTEDSYALEKAVVECFDCSEEYPLCLYDFTSKQIMIDY